MFISETFFNYNKFVTDRDNNIYKCDNFYLYNQNNILPIRITVSNLEMINVTHALLKPRNNKT